MSASGARAPDFAPSDDASLASPVALTSTHSVASPALPFSVAAADRLAVHSSNRNLPLSVRPASGPRSTARTVLSLSSDSDDETTTRGSAPATAAGAALGAASCLPAETESSHAAGRADSRRSASGGTHASASDAAADTGAYASDIDLGGGAGMGLGTGLGVPRHTVGGKDEDSVVVEVEQASSGVLPFKKLRKKRKPAKQLSSEQATPTSRNELMQADMDAAREQMVEQQARYLQGSVLTRTGFALNAFLEPETEQQRSLAAAAAERKVQARRQHDPVDADAMRRMTRRAFCWKMFSKHHPLLAKASTALLYAALRLFFIFDWGTDLIAARELNRFNAGWGGFLGFLLFLPYLLLAPCMYGAFMREMPRLAKRLNISYGGEEAMKAAFVLGAPLWMFIADVYVTTRYFFTPVTGHYATAFANVRRLILLLVEVSITSLLQIQATSSNITGVRSLLINQAIIVSVFNLVVNGLWLYKAVTAQHKPFPAYIKGVLVGGVLHIPGLDNVQNGVEELAITGGLSHWTEVVVVATAISDAGTSCRLAELSLQRCMLDDQGIHVLLDCLNTNTTITTLNLSHNEIRTQGLQHLSSCLLVNKTILHLTIAHNHIRDEGVQELARTLRSTANTGRCSLVSLDLGWNQIQAVGAHALSLALRHNHCNLQQLDVSYCALGDEGVAAIAKALSTNALLKELKLCNVDMGLAGAQGIAHALTSNLTLEFLAISGNNAIGDIGCVAFWEVFANNHPLKHLEMSGCGMTSESAKILAENLEYNSNLQFLDFSFNDIGQDLIVEMGNAMLLLPSLKVLLVAANSLTREEYREKVKTNEALLGLTNGPNPRLRFKPYPK